MNKNNFFYLIFIFGDKYLSDFIFNPYDSFKGGIV